MTGVKLLRALSLCITLLPGLSWAACSHDKLVEITLPDITLTPSEKGTPGTVLYTHRQVIPAINYSCGSTVKSTWRSMFLRSEFSKTSISNVYSTGIAGIGIRIKWPESRGSNAFVPGSYSCQGDCTEPMDTLVVEFVQTGNSRSGRIAAGPLMEVDVSPDNNPSQTTTLFRLNSNPITVQVRSCSIVVSSNYIDLGDYSLADVQSRGFSAAKKDFDITLNCPDRSSAKIQFDGKTAWGMTSGVVTNKGSAQNVWVKLYSKTGVRYQELELNKQLNFGSVAAFSGTRKVNYAAEMYFDEGFRSQITAGNVEASVVFTLTID